MTKPVINIFRTEAEALTFKNSPVNSFYRFNGVQLLPNNEIPYVQVTNTPLGLNLEDWTVYAVDLRTNVEQDITDSFNVDSLTNSDNGNPQLYWSLTNVPIDFGYNLIYLRIEQALGETFYSQSFMLTDYRKEYTTQFHYKERKGDVMQSIGIKTWFRQEKEETELSTYFELSTQLTVTEAIKVNETEIYYTEQMSIDQLKKLAMILRSPYCYIDGYRAYLYKALEIPDLKSSENFAQINFQVSIDENTTAEEVQTALSKGDFLAADFDANDFFIYEGATDEGVFADEFDIEFE